MACTLPALGIYVFFMIIITINLFNEPGSASFIVIVVVLL